MKRVIMCLVLACLLVGGGGAVVSPNFSTLTVSCLNATIIQSNLQDTTLENRINYSEYIANPSWIKQGSSGYNNITPSPVSGVDAGSFNEWPTTGEHSIVHRVYNLSNNTVYTYSVYLKPATRSYAAVRSFSKSGGGYVIYVNLTDGTITSTSGTGYYTNVSADNNWWRFSIAQNTSSGTTTPSFTIFAADAPGNITYPGAGGYPASIYVWGAQVESTSPNLYTHAPNPKTYLATYSQPSYLASWGWYVDNALIGTSQFETRTFADGTSYNISLIAVDNLGSTTSWKNQTYTPTCDLKYQSVGDSMTVPTYTYVMQMRDIYDPTALGNHTPNGGGMSSSWVVANLDTLPIGKNQYLLIGTNDRVGGVSGSVVAANDITAYNYWSANGSTVNILLPILANPSAGGDSLSYVNQYDNMTLLKAGLTAAGISSIDTWDAIDSIPNNGVMDEVNVSLLESDGIHPTSEAQGLIAVYVWNHDAHSLTASFTPSGPINVYYPTGTLFTDTSTGSPTAWNWTYKTNNAGSGVSFNTTRNATFFPQKGGNFTIQLNASTVSSYNLSTQVTWVNVSQADFLRNVTTGYQYPMPVQFTDMSTGVPTNWSWDFGDTYTSTQRNPMHIYTVSGTYNVNLTVWNATWGFVSTQKPVTLSTDDDIWLRAWDQYENATIIDLKGVAWTNSGGVLSAPGKFGLQSLYLTGNNYVYSASSPIWDRSALAGEVEAWFNVSAYGDAGKPFFRRSSGTSGTANGWGFFNINGTSCGNAFYYGSSTNYTTPFCMPLNTWTHAVLVRGTDQYWRVYVNGVLWGTPVYMGTLNVDTANPFMIGSSGPGTEPTFRIDEFRYTQGVPRFVSDFSTPYAMYRGSTQPMIDTSPNSTYRYKTNPGSLAIIYNQTNGGTRNRTVQVQNISEALYLIGGGNFDTRYELVKNVFLNKTDYSDLVLESYSIDNVGGVVAYNVSRGGVNHITAPFDTRTNFLDVQVLYYNYTESSSDFQYFAYGYLINDSSTYPIHNFIATPITYGMWGEPIIDFSANTTTPNILSTVQFTDSTLNYPDTYLWDFGDGSTSTLKNPTHVYTSLGTYDVTETAWLAANTSITNTSTKTSYITVLSSAGVPAADFSGSPLLTNIGTPVSFTDLSTGVPTSWVWDFGDSSGSALQNPSHAYSALGLYTVNLTVANVNGTTTMSKTSYVNVTNATMSGYNQQDIEMDPAYTLTLHVVDSSTNAAIPDVSILDSNGNTYNTTTGTFTLSYGYGAVVLYLSSNGYTSKSVSYVMDSDRDETVQMRAEEDVVIQPIVSLPEKIQFHIQTFFGAPISDATVTAYGYTTTTGSWDWVITLLGVQLDEAPINTSIMSGSTDSNGDIEFLMLSSAKYNITTTAPGYTFPEFRVSPHDKTYTIVADVNTSSWWGSGENQQLETNITVNKAVKNSTYGFINVTYYDPNGKTTGGNIYLYRPNTTRGGANVLVTTIPITSSSFTSSNGVPIDAIRGADYIVEVAAVTSD